MHSGLDRLGRPRHAPLHVSAGRNEGEGTGGAGDVSRRDLFKTAAPIVAFIALEAIGGLGVANGATPKTTPLSGGVIFPDPTLCIGCLTPSPSTTLGKAALAERVVRGSGGADATLTPAAAAAQKSGWPGPFGESTPYVLGLVSIGLIGVGIELIVRARRMRI